MKKYLVLLVIVSGLFLSCSEEFDINAPRKEVYAINCILNNDEEIQYAIVTKNYVTMDGSIPPHNSQVEYIKGAIVKLFTNNKTYLFRDTVVNYLKDGKSSILNCYYLRGLDLNGGTNVSIEAIFPNGEKVTSTVYISRITFVETKLSFPYKLDGDYSYESQYYWDYDTKVDLLVNPLLQIHYYVYKNGKYVKKIKTIPVWEYYSFYPVGFSNPKIPEPMTGPAFNIRSITTIIKEINKSFQEISENDPNKSDYIIKKITLDVNYLDPIVTKYVLAYKIFNSDFTAKLRQPEVTNIGDCKGIFGVRYHGQRIIPLDSTYVHSFGYQYKP